MAATHRRRCMPTRRACQRTRSRNQAAVSGLKEILISSYSKAVRTATILAELLVASLNSR